MTKVLKTRVYPDEYGMAYKPRPTTNSVDHEPLKLYPNPASDAVSIEFENPDFSNIHITLKIYSVSGKLIHVYQLLTADSSTEVSTENLLNGVYLYQITLDNGLTKSGKLVILKQ
jgi:hypothetical protein